MTTLEGAEFLDRRKRFSGGLFDTARLPMNRILQESIGHLLSRRKFRDNAVRLQLHALAYNIANFMRSL